MKALVLSGGGALGAYEAGAISMLCRKIEFDLVCGTSIGALNASFVAQNRLDDLEIVWKTIGESKIITLDPTAQALSDFAMGVIAFQKTNALARLLGLPGLIAAFRKIGPLDAVMNLLGGLAPKPIADVLQRNVEFERLAKPLIVSATNLTTGNSDAFYYFPDSAAGAAFASAHDKGATHPLTPDNLRDAIRSSAAIPFAFAPVPVAVPGDVTSLFVDGGVANNTPLGVAIDAGATDVTVIFLNPTDSHEPQKIGNLAQIGLSCFGIMQERILELDFKDAVRVNAAVSRDAGGSGSTGERRPIVLRSIRPAKTLPITVLQFDQQNLIDAVYALGVADAQAALN